MSQSENDWFGVQSCMETGRRTFFKGGHITVIQQVCKRLPPCKMRSAMSRLSAMLRLGQILDSFQPFTVQLWWKTLFLILKIRNWILINFWFWRRIRDCGRALSQLMPPSCFYQVVAGLKSAHCYDRSSTDCLQQAVAILYPHARLIIPDYHLKQIDIHPSIHLSRCASQLKMKRFCSSVSVLSTINLISSSSKSHNTLLSSPVITH